MFVLSSGSHDIDHLVPAVSLVRHLQLGYFLVAGGSVLGFLGGALCLTAPRRAAKKAGQAVSTPMGREREATPSATRGGTWGRADDASGAPASVDSQTPVGVGSGR